MNSVVSSGKLFWHQCLVQGTHVPPRCWPSLGWRRVSARVEKQGVRETKSRFLYKSHISLVNSWFYQRREICYPEEGFQLASPGFHFVCVCVAEGKVWKQFLWTFNI